MECKRAMYFYSLGYFHLFSSLFFASSSFSFLLFFSLLTYGKLFFRFKGEGGFTVYTAGAVGYMGIAM